MTNGSEGILGRGEWEPRLLVIHLQRWMSRVVKIRIVSSVLLLFVPLVTVGAILQVVFETPVLTRGVLIALVWIALAPWLIEDAIGMTNSLLCDYKPIFVSGSDWSVFTGRQMGRLQSSAYLYFGLPWAAAVTAVVVGVVYRAAPLAIQVWAGVSFFLLFLISAIGFRGVFVLVSIIQELCSSSIRFAPYHPDRFGGLNGVGSYAVRGALYFSSGALVFPLVFEILGMLGASEGLMRVAVGGLVAVFIAFTVAAFLVPVAAIKRFVGEEKTKVLLSSRVKLDQLTARLEAADGFDPKTVTEIVLHYHLSHSELLKIKDYPYDARVGFEFTASILIPVVIATMDLFLR